MAFGEEEAKSGSQSARVQTQPLTAQAEAEERKNAPPSKINKKDREPEINSDEYERIRIMLGAG